MHKRAVFFHVFFTILLLSRAEGLQIITSGGYQGVADSEGTVVIPAIYETLGWSDGGRVITREAIGYRENGKWGLISIKDKKITEAKYTILRPFDGEYFEAGVTGRFSNLIFRGLIDAKARVQVGFRYFSIEPFAEGRLLVSEYKDGKVVYGLQSYANERVIEVEYESLKRLDDFVIAENSITKSRIYTLDGDLVIDEWVDGIEKWNDDYLLTNEGKYGLLSLSARLIHAISYKTIEDHEKAIPFPKWEVRKIGEPAGHHVYCDSIVYHPEDEILIAHVNDVTHILGASSELFRDQQHILRYAGNGFLVTQNVALGHWGIYKTNGTEVASGFDSIAVDSSYFFTKTNAGWDIYNLFGRKINERPYRAVGYSQQRIIPVKKNDYWGWIDFQGTTQIDFKYDKVRNLGRESHFAANYLNKWGVSSINGTWIILPEYDEVINHSDYYVALKGLASHIYTPSGHLVAKLPYQIDDKGFLRLEQDDKFGLVTSEGVIIDPAYNKVDMISGFYELNGEEGLRLINAAGREVIKPEDGIEDVISYSEGYFLIKKEGKYGFVDENGKLRVAHRYDDALRYEEGLAPVSLLGRWGFIDKYEILVIQPYYKYSSTFEKGRAIVQIEENFGIIDREGQEVLRPVWKNIERLLTGNYLVTDWDGKKGLANADGQFILRANFEDIKDTDKELIIATRGGKKGVLDYRGFTKVPFVYDDLKIQGEYLLLLKEG